MHRNFTLENHYPNKLQNTQEINEPDKQTIRNLLAYSKALSVINSQLEMGKKKICFHLVLN